MVDAKGIGEVVVVGVDVDAVDVKAEVDDDVVEDVVAADVVVGVAEDVAFVGATAWFLFWESPSHIG